MALCMNRKKVSCGANVPHKAFVTQNKPLFKVSFATANKKLQEFITRYVSLSDQQSITSMVAKSPLSAQTWILQVGAALALSKLVREQKTVKSFLLDVEKMLFLDEIPHGIRHYLLVNFQEHGSNAKINLFEQYWLWTALLIISPKGKIFYQDIQDYFVSRCSKIKTGSFITACWLKLKNKNLFYHPEGFWGFYRAILNSTPYKDYLDDANVEERQ